MALFAGCIITPVANRWVH